MARYRGKLIRPLIVEIAQYDIVATDAFTAPGVTSGFDDFFREPVKVDAAADGGPGERVRIEKDPHLFLPAQIEPEIWEAINVVNVGNSPESMLGLVLHFEDLEASGLVHPDGTAHIKVSDRIVALYAMNEDGTTGAQVVAVNNPPGLYVDEAQPRGLGMGGNRNLLLLKVGPRGNDMKGA